MNNRRGDDVAFCYTIFKREYKHEHEHEHEHEHALSREKLFSIRSFVIDIFGFLKCH